METDSLTFVGNATTLIRYAGFTLLTDPNFVPAGESVPVGLGLTVKRLKDPSMTIDELPPIDAVILSHYHGDHFDHLAEERLDRELPILTTNQAAADLAAKGFSATIGLDTWDTHDLRGETGYLRLTSMPAQHAPSVADIIMPSTMGSFLEFWSDGRSVDDDQPDLKMYITGDTILFDGLDEIVNRVPAIDLAVVHLGGTRVLGITVTLDGEHGAELVEKLGPNRMVPVHVDDYDAFESPLSDFTEAMEARGLNDRVIYLDRGESADLAQIASEAATL